MYVSSHIELFFIVNKCNTSVSSNKDLILYYKSTLPIVVRVCVCNLRCSWIALRHNIICKLNCKSCYEKALHCLCLYLCKFIIFAVWFCSVHWFNLVLLCQHDMAECFQGLDRTDSDNIFRIMFIRLTNVETQFSISKSLTKRLSVHHYFYSIDYFFHWECEFSCVEGALWKENKFK